MVLASEGESCVMAAYKEHAIFPGFVLLVIGAVAFQMTRDDAVSLPSDPPAVVKTISATHSASTMPVGSVVDPI